MSLLGNTLVRSRTLPGCLIVALLLVANAHSPCSAQSDDAPEATAFESESPKSGFSNPFGKLFARKPSEDPDDNPKSSRPAISLKPGSTLFRPGRPKPSQPETQRSQPEEGPSAATETRGGLLVPLKSFTNRVFRQNADESEETPDLTSPPSIASEEPNRPFREPFKNLPRPRSLSNREENGIELEEIVVPPPAPARAPKPIATQEGTPPEGTPPVVNRSSPGGLSSPEPDESLPSYRGVANTSRANNPARAEPLVGKRPNAPLPSNNSSRRSADPILDTTDHSPKKGDVQNTVPSLIDLSSDSLSKRPDGPAPINKPIPNDPRNIPSSAKRASEATPSQRPIETAKADEVDFPRVTTTRSANSKIPGQTISSRATRGEDPPVAPNRQPSPSNPPSSVSPSLGSMQLPGVRVSVQGPDALLVGQDANFEILAKNEGNVDLNGLLLRISVPASVDVGQLTASHGQAEPEDASEEHAIGWEIPKLQAGAQVSLRVNLRTNKPEHFAMGIEWTAVPQSQEYAIRVQQPQLEVALEGPSEVEFGAPQNYRLRIRNPGNAVAKSVEVILHAGSFGSNQSKIGDVPPGDEKVIDVELLFEQNGSIPVTATARSEAARLEAKGAIQVKVKQSVLEASWSGPAEFFQGTAAEYRVTVVNRGDLAASNAECTLRIPEGASPSSLPSGAIRKGNFIHWDIKRLQPQESVSFPFALTMNETGENVLEFETVCKSGSPLASKHTTLIDSIIDLKLHIKDPVAPAPVGQPVVYEIEIHNRGSKDATGVQVLAQFSEGIEPVRFEGAEGRILPGQVLFEPIGNVAAGSKVTLRVFAEASQQGVHRFRAEVKCEAGEANLLQEESTRFLASRPTGTDD